MAKNELRADRYAAGKTIKEEEFGVLFPDGVIDWSMYPNSPERRATIVTDWERMLSPLHVIPDVKLRFVKRTVTTKFSDISFVGD